MPNDVFTHYVRIPAELNKDSLLDAVGIGLYQIFSGNRAKEIPETEKIKNRVKISSKGEEILNTLLKDRDFKSKNEIFINAMAVMAEKPEWLRKVKI